MSVVSELKLSDTIVEAVERLKRRQMGQDQARHGLSGCIQMMIEHRERTFTQGEENVRSGQMNYHY